MNENIDLTKILKDCPEGTELYSPLCGKVVFKCIKNSMIYTTDSSNSIQLFSKEGFYYYSAGVECLLFPSAEQRDWRRFKAHWYNKKPEPKFKVGDWIISSVLGTARIIGVNDSNEYQLEYIDSKQKFSSIDYVNYAYDKWTIQDAKDGDVLALSWWEDENLWEKIVIFKKYHSEGIKGLYSDPCVEGYGNTFKNGEMAFTDEEVPYYSRTWTCNLHPATKEQRDLLFQKIKEAGYKWNAETNTLEKLIKPKFKVGDRIRHKETNKDDVYEISKVYDDSYGIAGFTWMIYMKYLDQYELVPNRFDPKTLQPFDKILMRDHSTDEWDIGYFSYIKYDLAGFDLSDCEEEGEFLVYTAGGANYWYAVPYNEDTKHLVGTTEEAPEYYRYWEE